MPGLFVTFEGPEGAGKSTQVELLRRALASSEPVVVREPGGTELGERIRELLLHDGHARAPAAEMHLFMAARAEIVAAVVEPALRDGRLVIADRYHDSTLAYQGGGRGIEAPWPAYFPRPDLTFLLDLPVAEGRRRQAAAGRAPDRLESESLEFHRAVMAAYRRLAAADPVRWVVLDARPPAGAVHDLVLGRLAPLWKGAVRSS
ncbi:MAG: dTMP kinase [Candidatus Dormibacteraceae bacterium]